MTEISSLAPPPPLSLPAPTALEIRDAINTINAAYDWTSPTDPDNPRNAPQARRLATSAAVTLLAFTGTVAGAIYAPAQHLVAREFGCSDEVAVLPLALYNLGLAFGPLVGAPLSETYGRKTVFMVATPVVCLFLLGSALSRGITSLIVCRFFAGMFASPLINNASAVILDCIDGRYRGTTLSVYYTVPSFGAVFGPLIGGLIVQQRGWRWSQWTALIITGALFVPVCFTKETYKKVILQRRAIRLGLQDSSSQRTSPARAFRYFATTLVQRPVHMLFTEPIVTLVSLYNGFLFGIMYNFVVAVPWIFQRYYGFDTRSQSLSFIGLNCGTVLGCVPLILVDVHFYQKRLLHWQRTHGDDEQFPPENRVVAGLFGKPPPTRKPLHRRVDRAFRGPLGRARRLHGVLHVQLPAHLHERQPLHAGLVRAAVRRVHVRRPDADPLCHEHGVPALRPADVRSLGRGLGHQPAGIRHSGHGPDPLGVLAVRGCAAQEEPL